MPGDPSAPDALSGYDLVRELGRGGMGVVYQAYDRQRRHMMALKTMQGVEPSALYRFKAEFRTLAGLAHPNLVTLYELVEERGLWFFTMELLDGVSFLTHVRFAALDQPAATRPPRGLTPAQMGRLRDTLRQLAAGVHALHQAGKLHRDI